MIKNDAGLKEVSISSTQRKESKSCEASVRDGSHECNIRFFRIEFLIRLKFHVDFIMVGMALSCSFNREINIRECHF